MDAEKPVNDSEGEPRELFTEPSYEGRRFESLSCSNVELKDIEFYQCRFHACQFLRAVFRRCRFEQCVFEKCDLSVLKTPETAWNGVRFLGAKMLGIDWTVAAAPLTLSLQGSNVSHSIFLGISLQRMEMVECIAREADFTRTNLSRANLTRTDFLGSRFADTDLRYADLSKATNYAIDPTANRVKKAVFSLPEAMSLLSAFDIVLK